MPAIVFPPTWYPVQWSFRPRPSSVVFTSPFSAGSMQVIERSIPVWTGSGVWRKHGDDGAAFEALAIQLAGPQNLLRMPNFARLRTAAGTHEEWAGLQTAEPWDDGSFWSDGTGWIVEGRETVATAGAAQWAKSISVDGLRPLGTYVPGDCFGVSDGVHERLYMIVAPVTADALGRGTLTFEPALRGPVTEGDAVNLVNPTTPVRMIDDDQLEGMVEPHLVYTHEAKFVEDLTEIP